MLDARRRRVRVALARGRLGGHGRAGATSSWPASAARPHPARRVSTNVWGGLLLTILLSVVSITLSFPFGRGAGHRSPQPPAGGAAAVHGLHRDRPRRAAHHHPLHGGAALPALPARERPHRERHPGHGRPDALLGGLRGRERARRPAGHPVRPGRGRPGHRPAQLADQPLRRPAAGAAHHHPGQRGSLHQPAQGHHAGRHRRPPRAARRRAAPCSPSRSGWAPASRSTSFVAVVFFVLCYALSQASYRLEKELGVGER